MTRSIGACPVGDPEITPSQGTSDPILLEFKIKIKNKMIKKEKRKNSAESNKIKCNETKQNEMWNKKMIEANNN